VNKGRVMRLARLLALLGYGINADPAPGLSAMPSNMILAAPYQPFRYDGSLNATAENIDMLAAQAAGFGVTTVWVPGSMAQFDTMTLQERKRILELWVPTAKKHSLYLIAHVGSTSLGDAAELADHAARVGADAIASLPPYYEQTTDVPTIVSFLARISIAAPMLPFFYYHLPATTGADIKVKALLDRAAAPCNGSSSAITAPCMPTLAGVKFVSSDLADWMDCVRTYNSTRALMFAPEPKLASFALGTGRGTVLAEDFFAPSYIRMQQRFLAGDAAGAADEQAFRLAALQILSRYGGGTAERALYRRFPASYGFDYGPPRLPRAPFRESDWHALEAELDAIGFWEQYQS